MARGKKPRRAMSKTELAMRNPVWSASKQAPMTREQQVDLALQARVSFDAIISGQCGDGDPDALAMVANVSMVLCERGIGEEYLPRVIEAQNALVSAQLRANEGKAFNFDGLGRAAVLDLLDLHEQHIALASHLQVMQALATVADRLRAGHFVDARRAPGR